MSTSIFVLSIVASIIAGYFLSVSSFLGRYVPFRFGLTIRNIGVRKVYRNQNSALKSIRKDILKSGFIHVLTVKGDTFSRPDDDSRGQLHRDIARLSIEQKYLISSIENPYVVKRGIELNAPNFVESVRFSISNFDTLKQSNNKIKVELHKEVIRFRLILLDNNLYLSFQEVDTPGRESPVLKIVSGSPLYNTYKSLFNDLWDHYKT